MGLVDRVEQKALSHLCEYPTNTVSPKPQQQTKNENVWQVKLAQYRSVSSVSTDARNTSNRPPIWCWSTVARVSYLSISSHTNKAEHMQSVAASINFCGASSRCCVRVGQERINEEDKMITLVSPVSEMVPILMNCELLHPLGNYPNAAMSPDKWIPAETNTVCIV